MSSECKLKDFLRALSKDARAFSTSMSESSRLGSTASGTAFSSPLWLTVMSGGFMASTDVHCGAALPVNTIVDGETQCGPSFAVCFYTLVARGSETTPIPRGWNA